MKKSTHVVGHLLLGLAVVAGFGAAVMLSWNALLPRVFGIATIDFWQALGLLVLCRVLFSGFGGRWMFAGGSRFHGHHVREKWSGMTPEERERFIKRHGFGFGHFPGGEEPRKEE
jgi:hypothetical protein